jgi:adsorption protein B
MDWGALIDAAALLVREISLFAAAGFLLLGASDLAVDLAWLAIRLKRLTGGAAPPAAVPELPNPAKPGRLAVFVPAWDESAVIGQMLAHALRVFDHSDYRIYVGCYPNDPATAQAVLAMGDPRIRLVVGTAPGPTTKADCLNTSGKRCSSTRRRRASA